MINKLIHLWKMLFDRKYRIRYQMEDWRGELELCQRLAAKEKDRHKKAALLRQIEILKRNLGLH